MTRFFLGFLAVGALFFVSKPFLQKNKEKRIWLQNSQQEVTTYRPFVILTASYNNKNYYKKNLRSVFEQKYPNFRVIYINDASTDGTGESVFNWIKNAGVEERVELVQNTANQGALANFHHAIQSCKDHEIIVFLDGDDWLAHDEVLLWLNRAYEDPETWMTYGSYILYPNYRRGWNKKISEKIHKNRNYRTACSKEFLICHLKTAYASLLKRVQKKDLLYKGKFFSMNSDLALFFPAIEMAGKHARYIRDVLYIYNRETPLNDNKKNLVIHQYTRKIIENLPKYNLLTKLEDDLQSFPEEISTYEEVDSLSSLP